MLRSIDKWLPGYLASVLRRPRWQGGVRHLFFCVADHFEPFRGGIPGADALGLVERWCEEYPHLADRFRDSDGQPPRHTFFYPAEEYDAEVLDRLAELCRSGYGEVEIHLHHRNDTPEGFRDKLACFRDRLAERHGLLGRDSEGRPRYAFIHGNWALCNSRPDGDWCGVDEELGVLAATGCYADLTFPSAPSPTQPRTVNAIYRAADRPGRPGGHERGEHARLRVAHCGLPVTEDGECTGRSRPTDSRETSAKAERSTLLLIQGPLALNWHRRKWGVLPRLENGEITGVNPPTSRRVDLWVRQAIGVVGRPDWVFVKVHTHGCVAANMSALLGDPMAAARTHLQRMYRDAPGWQFHYVTAREMFNLVLAAEDGVMDPETALESYAIGPPRLAGKR